MSNESITAFANRLKKNQKMLGKWARKQGITAYRVFDRDIPEIPLRVERYGDEGVVWIYESEKGAPSFLKELLQQVEPSLNFQKMHIKRRERQIQGEQYEKLVDEDLEILVEEYGCHFGVNLQKYLDTGLFLDHRDTRYQVQKSSAGKRLLNLFCYTGAFSIHAAVGGAIQTTSVDLSRTYLKWTGRNFKRNDVRYRSSLITCPADLTREGLHLKGHSLVAQDAFAFLKEAAREGHLWDVVVLDPPTMSRSKRMQGMLDVQRDHVELIELVEAVLAPEGRLYFSNNYRGFQLHETALRQWSIKELTPGSLPKDVRNKNSLNAYLLEK
ncbi:MAG: SAM-dependent methyltransferase [Deltaproteobacteria bacterium]|nr:SAM-dependent methyltransferase [Deltaproteobacteria bacterium]